MFAVTKDDASDVADPVSIDKYPSGFNRSGQLHRIRRQLDHLPQISKQNMIRVNSHRTGQRRMLGKVFVFAVNRNEEFRLNQAHQQLELILTCVARDMHFIHRFADDFGTQFEQIIDDPRHMLFIAGNRVGRNDDKVTRRDLDLAVLACCHSRQGRHRFTLAASCDDHQPVSGIMANPVGVNQNIFGNIQIAKLNCSRHNIDHAPAGNSNLPVMGSRQIDNLLDAVNI